MGFHRKWLEKDPCATLRTLRGPCGTYDFMVDPSHNAVSHNVPVCSSHPTSSEVLLGLMNPAILTRLGRWLPGSWYQIRRAIFQIETSLFFSLGFSE